jgi:hypothetical protein
MNMQIDIFSLFEDLRKHIGDGYDEIFYDAPEGDAQLCIVKEMLEMIWDNI